MMQSYIAAVVSLDPKCTIGSRILGEAPNVHQLAEDVCIAVEAHLNGHPDEARKRIRAALAFVSSRLFDMLSLDVPSDKLQRLFRASEIHAGEPPLNRERLFHLPFQSLARAISRRYSLPGSACLHFGGCLKRCMRKCDADAAKLPSMAIAEFAPRKPVKFLDFGYRPSAYAGMKVRASFFFSGGSASIIASGVPTGRNHKPGGDAPRLRVAQGIFRAPVPPHPQARSLSHRPTQSAMSCSSPGSKTTRSVQWRRGDVT